MFAKRSGFLNTRVQSALAPAIRPKQPCFRRYLNEYIKSVLARPVGIATSRMFFKKDGSLFSPWHDIPLVADATKDEYNMVCEIPRWTNAKLEIDTKAAFNPIRQDTKNGNLRYVSDIFPYKGYIWNYGALPQTFEDPAHVDTDTGYVGDSDPVDVIEIGQAVCAQGCVYRVKVLGVVALIDDGETDWKVIALRSDDPLASKVHSVDCLEKYMPGLLNATIDWFTKYKVPDGKPLNKWAFDGKARDAEYARNIIAGTHHAWKKLVGLQHSKFSIVNTTVKSSPHYLTPNDVEQVLTTLPENNPEQIHTNEPLLVPTSESANSPGSKWYFVSGNKVCNQDKQ